MVNLQGMPRFVIVHAFMPPTGDRIYRLIMRCAEAQLQLTDKQQVLYQRLLGDSLQLSSQTIQSQVIVCASLYEYKRSNRLRQSWTLDILCDLEDTSQTLFVGHCGICSLLPTVLLQVQQ